MHACCGGGGRTAEDPERENGVPSRGPGRGGVAVAVGLGRLAVVHAVVGFEAAGVAEVAAVAVAAADDLGGARRGGVEGARVV